ncbi:MAG TPA: hypothetical protein VFC68_02880 [Treponemataceae bacterium]|nr:hypothetical protein [Treponemataceae bacterium]
MWCNNEVMPGFPIKLAGLFYNNVFAFESCFIALSDDGICQYSCRVL